MKGSRLFYCFIVSCLHNKKRTDLNARKREKGEVILPDVILLQFSFTLGTYFGCPKGYTSIWKSLNMLLISIITKMHHVMKGRYHKSQLKMTLSKIGQKQCYICVYTISFHIISYHIISYHILNWNLDNRCYVFKIINYCLLFLKLYAEV